ncbi:MAG: AI-2E family transporter [Christensenellales bacterium]|jgi:predicted PurR-regulated permease PerM
MTEPSRSNRRPFLLLFSGIAFFVALWRLDVVAAWGGALLSLLTPFIAGLCVAFILNVLMRFLENKAFTPLNKRCGKVWRALRRPLCLILTMAIFAGVLLVVLLIIVPEIKNTVQNIAAQLPGYLAQAQQWLVQTAGQFGIAQEQLALPQVDWEQAMQLVVKFFQSGSLDFINKTMNVTGSIFSGVFNTVVSLVFAIYLLLQKERLLGQLQRLMLAYLPEKRCQRLFEIGRLSSKVFSNFFAGQFIEAIILGVLCGAGMAIFRMPYALTIGVLVGFLALIPIFGAITGTVVGALLILMVDPLQAVWFVVFLVILQQIEGNLIYPRVVGTSVGLPGIWVLLAVSVGGGAFGVMGMLVSVPLASVIYTLLRQSVRRRTRKRLGEQAETTPTHMTPPAT